MVLVAINVIQATLALAVGGEAVLLAAVLLAAVLLALDALGWRITSRLFDRERLITGTR